MYAARAWPSCLALAQLSTPGAEKNAGAEGRAPRGVGARGRRAGQPAGRPCPGQQRRIAEE